MTRNYELVYYIAPVGIIGILAYPKISSIQKRDLNEMGKGIANK